MRAGYIVCLASLLMLVCGHSEKAGAQTLGVADIDPMYETYKANEARFIRDYVGKTFSAFVPFKAARENIFLKGHFNVSFGGETFAADVDCTVSDRTTINMIVDWNRGDMIGVTGIVKDHTMGTANLERCSFSC
jgi:hypothetical protein